MKTKLIIALLTAAAAFGQDIRGIVGASLQQPSIAVPDFRGAGDAQRFMTTFNQTLWSELAGSGALKMVDKSYYPLDVPQQPEDFKPPAPLPHGPWLTDWSRPPVNANYLVMGYAAVQDGQLVLRGWLFNTGQPNLTNAQVFGRLYFGTVDAAGAKKVARQFAAEILQQFGIKSLEGSRIYFVSDRSGHKEIWSMDYDGSDQRQVTNYRALSQSPAVSLGGKVIACDTLAPNAENVDSWQIRLRTSDGVRLPFRNPKAPTNITPDFTPDGKRILFSSSLSGYAQIYSADLEGNNLQRITNTQAIDVSPRVNPKNGRDVLFISDRSGSQQLWRMNIDGGDPDMLTDDEGSVSNPSWRPDGTMIAFAWTRGYERGNFNIFIMDIAKREPIQLTKDSGINENPWWGPDGLHIVFSSRRTGTYQIYSMLADGTNLKQLTTQGNNIQPVWVAAGN